MSNNKEKFEILYICSEKYSMLAGVSIVSLLINNENLEFDLKILASSWKTDTFERIHEIEKKYSRHIEVVDAKEYDKMLSEMGLPKFEGSYATYYRLFPSMVTSADKLLVIDADTIIDGSIEELMEFDFDNKAFAVSCHAGADTDITYEHKKSIGMKENDVYFQCGVILYDMIEWKRRNCEERIKRHICNVRADYPVVDQDIMSLLLQDDRVKLPVKYNFFDLLRYMDDTQRMKYFNCHEVSREELSLAYSNTVIYHFYYGFQGKPWCKGYITRERDIWNEYVKKSPWKNYTKWTIQFPFSMKILRLMFKILPWKNAMNIYISFKR